MSQICIRRTKEMQDSQGNPLIPLPPVRQKFQSDSLSFLLHVRQIEIIRVPVTLSAEARVFFFLQKSIN